jgi:prepilin-type processing-associated H-X9-DG protein
MSRGIAVSHRKRSVEKRRPGVFTLVELLVVISIIGMLMALLLPAVQSARESGRQNTCRNNQRNLGLAIIQYETQKKQYPGYVNLVNFNPRSWGFLILPQLERNDLWDRYSTQYEPDGTTITPQPSEALELMQCPSDPPEGTTTAPPSSYVLNTAMVDVPPTVVGDPPADWPGNGPFHDARRLYEDPNDATTELRRTTVRAGYISAGDGLQNTIMLSENVDSLSWILSNTPANWEREMGFIWDPTPGTASSAPDVPDGSPGPPVPQLAININIGVDTAVSDYTYARPSAYHPGGVNMFFMDGHGRFISQDINYLVYAQLMTCRGRQVRFPGTESSAPADWPDAIYRLLVLDEAHIP